MHRRQAIVRTLSLGCSLGSSLSGALGRALAAERDPLVVFAEHPRLLLRPPRLRLLRRERERQSARWQQFNALVEGQAPLAEPGFAYALHYQVSGQPASGRRALEWAAKGTDLRQLAIVFDWCFDLLSPTESAALAARIERAMVASTRTDAWSARDRAFAAIALFDHVPRTPAAQLDRLARQWWDAGVVASISHGRAPFTRDDAYPLFELLHGVRDSTNTDLRESVPRYFHDFPVEHLVSHYPASFPSPEGEFRIGASKAGEPDVRLAALSRAAEMAMVAYDVNAASSQVLQGWLMHDRYVMRGSLGAVYEFLWANPYQPGLSYYHVPLVHYNPDLGRLFVRSSWEENAAWFGYFDGAMQSFRDGRLSVLDPQRAREPLNLTSATLFFAHTARRFHATLDEDSEAYAIGLRPRCSYLVEVDDEEMIEASTDVAGILPLDLPSGAAVGVRLRETNAPAAPAVRRQSLEERGRSRPAPRP